MTTRSRSPGLFAPGSLAFRVVSFSTLWAVVALVAIATIISALYRQASERSFDSLLSAHLFNLISSVGANGEGGLRGDPDLGDLRFTVPRSGWYWSVEPVSQGLTGALRSQSMTEAIPSPPTGVVPFNSQFQRSYTTDGLAGELLQVFESEFVLGQGSDIARFRVMGNLTELNAEIAEFERQLYIYLAIFGAGMIAINAGAILYGLRPLRRVRDALTQVREGRAQRLDGTFPAEIEPLASETNALIENNRRIVERSRTQVGNLAHSLKTPLAVMMNEGRAIGGDKGRLIGEQANAMRDQVEHYLQRARIAAQRDSVVFRTPVGPALERMARVMAKLKPETEISLVLPEQEEVVFAGEREDFEEITGNLLDNAMKWAKGKVRVVVSPLENDPAGRFAVVIEDDGPGIPEDRARDALKRGRRLDESKPGSGLGLSIVAELVKEYGGRLALERSELGGLKAVVELRRAQ
jgi:signal transduction histidine kinase